MQAKEAEDPSLVAATLSGDQSSFRALVERYQSRMFGLVRHYTQNTVEIEDIVQDTFLKAFAKLDTFQSQSSFYTWLSRIAVNTALDFRKRHGRNPVHAVEDPEEAHGKPGSGKLSGPDRRMEAEEIAAITHRVLDELPEIFRTVLVLREFEELAYQEIADLLGISIGTVESRLFRARARFKDKLLQFHPEFGEA